MLNFLYRLKALNTIDGNLMVEGDTFFGQNHRCPDLAFYTEAQILAARKNENVVPRFVIEVISSKDQIIKVSQKMRDYRSAGVEVVWLVFPEAQEVHFYHGTTSVICTGEEICSAEPVMQGFKMAAQTVFA